MFTLTISNVADLDDVHLFIELTSHLGLPDNAACSARNGALSVSCDLSEIPRPAVTEETDDLTAGGGAS